MMKKVNKFNRTKGAWKSCSDEIEGQKKSVENKVCKLNKTKTGKTIIEESGWQIVLRKKEVASTMMAQEAPMFVMLWCDDEKRGNN